MGTYTDLSIGGYPIVTSKGDVVPEIMTVFRERDRAEIRLLGPEWPPMIWGPPDADCGDATATVYRCSVREAIDRLNVMGFTMRRVEEDFERIRQIELRRLKELSADGSNLWKDEQRVFRRLTFQSYARALKQIVAKRIRVWPFELDPSARVNSLVRYICQQHFEHEFGFLSEDPRSLVRLTCELVNKSATVMQDVSGLIAAGYYDEDEAICDRNRERLVRSYPENSSRIVLTEGSSDAAILRDALRLLYPHLADFFSFLDEWRQFGRPSGIFITKDDTIYVADSESGPDTGAHELPGIKKGIRIGSAKDGTVTAFIEDAESTTPDHSGAEGVGVDAEGNVYGSVVRRQMLERHVKK